MNIKRLLTICLIFACSGLMAAEPDFAPRDPGALRKAVFRYSGGAVQDPTFVDNGAGNITVNSCRVNLWDNADFEGYPKQYDFTATSIDLTDGVINYIVADYNNGSPIIKNTTNVELINESNVLPILTIYRSGLILHSLNWDELGLGLSNKIHQRLVKTQRFARESGLSVQNTNLSFVITEGKVWYGATRQTIEAVNSTTDTVLRVAPNGTAVSITAFDNNNYYDGNTLTELTPNRYSVNWIYRGIEQQKHVYVMLGTGDYTLAGAQTAIAPAAPALITSHAVLVGKVIIQKGATTPYSVQSAFDTQFSNAGVTVHNDLTGLNEGEYQHLTITEKDVAINGSDTLDFTAKTVTVADSITVGTPDLTVIGDGLGNVAVSAASVTVNADVHFDGDVTGLLHNDLTGLNEGDYQHLTITEKDAAINGSDTLDFEVNTIAFTDAGTTRTNLGLGDMALADTTNYVATSTLVAVLADYVTTSGLTTILGDYVTSTGLTTVLGDYVTNTGLTTTLSDYVTATGLTTILGDYVTNSGLTVILGDYVQTSSLGNMAFEDKSDYVATSALTTALSDYVLTSSLGDMAYEDKADYVATSTYTSGLAGKMNTDGSNATGIAFFTADEKNVAINGSSTVDFLAEDITATSVTVSSSIDVGSTPDVSVSGDGAGKLTLDATTTEVTGDLNVTATGSFTGFDVTGNADFTGATVTGLAHNDLTGLNDGKYQHLTTDEKSQALIGSTTVDFTAKDIDVLGNIELTPSDSGGSITNIKYFGVSQQPSTTSGQTVSAAKAGIIYALHPAGASGTITNLTGVELQFGSAATTGGVVTNAKGLLIKPTAMSLGTVTTATALEIASFTGTQYHYTTAYGLRSSLATVTEKTTYNLYIDGTAPNYIKGDTKIDGDVILTPKSAPSGAVAGAIYYDSDDNHFYGYNGTSWVQLDN